MARFPVGGSAPIFQAWGLQFTDLFSWGHHQGVGKLEAKHGASFGLDCTLRGTQKPCTNRSLCKAMREF